EHRGGNRAIRQGGGHIRKGDIFHLHIGEFEPALLQSARQPVLGRGARGVDRNFLPFEIGDAPDLATVERLLTDDERRRHGRRLAVQRRDHLNSDTLLQRIEGGDSETAEADVEVTRRGLRDYVRAPREGLSLYVQLFLLKVSPLDADKERGIDHHGNVPNSNLRGGIGRPAAAARGKNQRDREETDEETAEPSHGIRSCSIAHGSAGASCGEYIASGS